MSAEELFNSLTEASQQQLISWEDALPNTTFAHYTTEPEFGDHVLVAYAYNTNGTVYDTVNLEAYNNVSAVLSEMMENNDNVQTGHPTDVPETTLTSSYEASTTQLPGLEKRIRSDWGWFCGIFLFSLQWVPSAILAVLM